MSCVLLINDLLSFRLPFPSFYFKRGVALQGRYLFSCHNDPDQDSISNLLNLQHLRENRSMMSRDVCLVPLESSIGWTNS
jgi:hypothetical protein